MAAVGAEALADLAAEFAGRRTARAARGAFGARLPSVRGEALQDGQGEGGGLAGAGLGDADQVAAGKDGRDGRGLDGRRARYRLFGEGAGNGLGEAEVE